jgi:hypothetical protein
MRRKCYRDEGSKIDCSKILVTEVWARTDGDISRANQKEGRYEMLVVWA